jgi:hypothetical protein
VSADRAERRRAANDRAMEAWDQRYKHGKAARTWDAIAEEKPARRELSKILAEWMYAYAASDARAEKAFRELGAIDDRGGESTEPTVTRAEFLRDPAAVLRRAEALQCPIIILGDDGKPSAIVSAPRDDVSSRT